MKSLFICNASKDIGIGHVMRCLSLAQAMYRKGWTCEFLTSKETIETVLYLKDSNFIVHLNQKEISDHYDSIIVDRYDWGAKEERGLRSISENLTVIDDLADRAHHCDVLIDQTYGREASDYASLVPEECQILVGSKYALLRPEFFQLRETAIKNNRAQKSIERLFISMGGTDPHNVTSKVLRSIENIKQLGHVDVVLHEKSSFKKSIEEQIERFKQHNIALHYNVTDIAQMMVAADLAIGAAGTTSWERCCLGLPTLMIEVADNQKLIAEGLDKAGAAVNLGKQEEINAQDITDKIFYFISHLDVLKQMSIAAMDIVDGNGVAKVISYLAREAENNIGLRLMDQGDITLLFDWQCNPDTRKYARNPKAPSWEEHQKWFFKSLNDPDRHLYMITNAHQDVGMLRLDKRDDEISSYEVSILIEPNSYGKGIGKSALSLIRRIEPRAALWAEILVGNNASQRLFEALNYKQIKDTWYRQESNENI